MAKVSAALQDFNLWLTGNTTSSNDESFEEGQLVILAQHRGTLNIETAFEDLEINLKKIKFEGVKVMDAKVLEVEEYKDFYGWSIP